ncbi:ral guanine nucleotide dissociation stimulator-like 1 isoform X3 [Lineus longissimus]|uniref:ral guanine nucleotide dissociation stimulator-like 1 isoform X3 n=1 Tax=Lineus longissimus TaxID=88925 RepID=UPI00315D5650
MLMLQVTCELPQILEPQSEFQMVCFRLKTLIGLSYSCPPHIPLHVVSDECDDDVVLVRWKRIEDLEEENNKYFREEKEDGAVYNVYLKKVVYNSFPEDVPPGDGQGSKLAWETLKVRQIKQGTLERLVESLVQETGQIDSTYVNVFLATYRSFASAKQVLNLLFKRYDAIADITSMKPDMKEIHRKSIRSVVHVWLDSFPEDYREPLNYPCLHSLLDFARTKAKDTDLENRAKHKLEKYRKQEQLDGRVPEIQYRFSMCDEVDGGDCDVCEPVHHKPYEFMSIPNSTLAEQLTYIDADLFRKVLPHHCLGAVWSKRGKDFSSQASSITATIDQFNALTCRVISTILNCHGHKTSHRAKVVMKWIDIAQELRVLKNFSSLKAIISGLQSNPIYRLRKTWAAISKDYIEKFESLSEIFSEENNQIVCRELLMKEGTAKFAVTDQKPGSTGSLRMRRSSSQRRKSWNGMGLIMGTVPYLGTFLTDLTMIDTAIPDNSEDGLINFEKRRKEFEVLAQLKLLQSAAQTYTIKPDPQFLTWFDSVPVLDEKSSYDLSCRIEPPVVSKTASLKKKSRLSSENLAVPASPSAYSSGEDRMSISSNNSSSPSPKTKHTPPIKHSMSMSSLESQDPKSSDTCVIKVCMEGDDRSIDKSTYKSIMLNNGDHTSSVIKRVLEKFSVTANHEDFCITQLLPDGDLNIPDKSNVYYAMNNSVDLLFVLRKKSSLKNESPKKFKSKLLLKKTPKKSLSTS